MKYCKGESQARKEIIDILEEEKMEVMQQLEVIKSIMTREKEKMNLALNKLETSHVEEREVLKKETRTLDHKNESLLLGNMHARSQEMLQRLENKMQEKINQKNSFDPKANKVRKDLITRLESHDEKLFNDINNGESTMMEITQCVRNGRRIVASMKKTVEETMDVKTLLPLLSKIEWMIERYDEMNMWLHAHGHETKDLMFESEQLTRKEVDHEKRTLDGRRKGLNDTTKNNVELVGLNQIGDEEYIQRKKKIEQSLIEFHGKLKCNLMDMSSLQHDRCHWCLRIEMWNVSDWIKETETVIDMDMIATLETNLRVAKDKYHCFCEKMLKHEYGCEFCKF